MFRVLLGKPIIRISSLEISSSALDKTIVLDNTLLLESNNGEMYQINATQSQTELHVTTDSNTLLTTTWELNPDEKINIRKSTSTTVDSTITEVTEIWQKAEHVDDYLVGLTIGFKNHNCLYILCGADQLNLVDCETFEAWISDSNKIHYSTTNTHLSD